jgi:hypothetical protein
MGFFQIAGKGDIYAHTTSWKNTPITFHTKALGITSYRNKRSLPAIVSASG